MEYRQAVFAVIIGTLILAGCAEGVAEPEMGLAPLHGGEIILPLIDDSQEDPSAASAPEDEASDFAGFEAYPADINADDPAGMIVTGLGELASSQIVSPWLVTVRTFRRTSGAGTLPFGDATIQLTQYAEDFPVSAHIRFFVESLDTCLIRSDQSEESNNSSSLPPPGISGGENVIFNTPSGPWFSLDQRRMADAQRIYRIEDLMPGALPAGTSLSVPGDAFPTVSDYPLFEPEAVVRLLPDASQPVTTESRFSWLPSGQPGHVKIDFMSFDQTDVFQGFPVSCWVIDDGSFELPGEVQEALEPFDLQTAGGLRLAVRYSRVYSRLDLIDGIVFQQTMEVAE